MQVSNLENQIVEILEKKYKNTIDKDDPLMLTITAQALVTEHLLELHKNNLKAQFEEFKEDLGELLDEARMDSDETKKTISEHIRKTFLEITDSYQNQLNQEFLKAGREYQKAQKWYKFTKAWAIGAFILSLFVVLVIPHLL
ncbi:MAG: hypothetical protein KKE61_11840 [Proteobacteria bacterium]|nr:hypothetical protein [Pseudomonadota bacterium]